MEEMGMNSIAEYIRAMVAAGQKEFSKVSAFSDADEEPMEQRIERELESDSYTSWEELIEGLTEDMEKKVERVLDKMDEAGLVEHSPRHGGWKLNDS